MRTHFMFLADPGHGWLIVTLGELAAVGLTETDINPYSYRHGEHLGLEEDLDARTFLEAYKARFGQEAEITTSSARAARGRPSVSVAVTEGDPHERAHLHCHP